MKRILVGVVLGATLVLGCSKSRRVEGEEGKNDAPPAASPPTTPAAPTAQSQSSGLSVSVRVLGVNNPGYTAVFAKVRDVQVEADGVQLTVERGKEDLDLSNGSQAWLLGEFSVPPGVDKVKMTAQFDDFGAFVTPNVGGWVDFRGSPITAELETADLQRNGHALLQLDLGKMLAKTYRNDERIYSTHFMVRY